MIFQKGEIDVTPAGVRSGWRWHEKSKVIAIALEHYKRSLDFIAGHYAEVVAFEDLANMAALSPSHFSRLFKRIIGQSPMHFVMTYRLEQAKKKLSRPK